MRDEIKQNVAKTEKSPMKWNPQNPDFGRVPPNQQNEATRGKQPTPVLERKRVPTKRYGIDVMRVEAAFEDTPENF